MNTPHYWSGSAAPGILTTVTFMVKLESNIGHGAARGVGLACWLWLHATSAGAADWDARTTLTNTAFTGTDVQRALNAGLTPAFVRAFPISQFDTHVQVDRHQMRNLPQDLVYVGLGLSSRLPNGDYRLAEGYYTDIVTLPKSACRENWSGNACKPWRGIFPN